MQAGEEGTYSVFTAPMTLGEGDARKQIPVTVESLRVEQEAYAMPPVRASVKIQYTLSRGNHRGARCP